MRLQSRSEHVLHTTERTYSDDFEQRNSEEHRIPCTPRLWIAPGSLRQRPPITRPCVGHRGFATVPRATLMRIVTVHVPS